MPRLVLVERNPFQVFANHARNVQRNPLIELAVLKKNIGARFIAERDVAGNGFDPLFPGIVDEKLRVGVTAIVTLGAQR
jgi:hypothetical protein